MSRRIHQAAFAIASDGTLLLNIAHFGRHVRPNELLRVALLQPGELFVGVKMTTAEAERVLSWSADTHSEAIAYVVGKRSRLRRNRNTQLRHQR